MFSWWRLLHRGGRKIWFRLYTDKWLQKAMHWNRIITFFFTCVQCHYLIIEGFLVPFKVSSINNAKLKYEASLKANFSDHTSVVHAFLSEFSTKERVLLSFALIQLQTLRLIEHCNYVSWGNIFEQALLLPLPFHSIKEIALITIVMQVKQPNVP